MRQRERFFLVFFIFILISIVFFLLSLGGNLKFASSILEKLASPIGGGIYSAFHKLPFVSENVQTKKLKDKNLSVVVQNSEIEKLKKENSALRDQFQTPNPKSYNLLPAQIIGAPSFIPGVTIPTNFILDKGEQDNIKVSLAVVFKNNLIGKIIQTSSNLSKAEVIVNNSSSFTAKTQGDVLGVIKGDGKTMTFDNVLLSENIKVGDIVTTKGDISIKGIGYPPDIIVGKIMSIDKNPSSLFQKARVESFVDFSKLSMVFIILRIE